MRAGRSLRLVTLHITLHITLHNGLKTETVSFFRSTILPVLIVALFGLALFAVSARIWLPGDMLAPAPVI